MSLPFLVTICHSSLLITPPHSPICFRQRLPPSPPPPARQGSSRHFLAASSQLVSLKWNMLGCRAGCLRTSGNLERKRWIPAKFSPPSWASDPPPPHPLSVSSWMRTREPTESDSSAAYRYPHPQVPRNGYTIPCGSQTCPSLHDHHYCLLPSSTSFFPQDNDFLRLSFLISKVGMAMTPNGIMYRRNYKG